MTGWTPDVSQGTIIGVGMVQGVGLGFLFVPLSAATLSTLPLSERTEGAGLYSLSRNIGSSVGISVVNSLVGAEHPGQSRRHCAERHRGQSRLRKSADRARLGSAHRRRPRRARRA